MTSDDPISSTHQIEIPAPDLPAPFSRDRFTWLAYLMLGFFGYLQSSLGPLMPFLRLDLNLSYTMGGFHFSALALGVVGAGLTGKRVVQAWGRRCVFWLGAGGMAAGALLLAASYQVLLTLAAAFLMGLLGAWLLVIIQAGLSDRHGSQRTIALTEANVAASLGASLAPLALGAFQGSGLGWRGALYLTMFVFGLMLVRFGGVSVPQTRVEGGGASSADQALSLSFWVYWAVICLCVAAEWCLTLWSAEFLENSVGLRQVHAATVMSVFFGAMVLGRVLGSWLSRVAAGASLLWLALGISLLGFPIFWLAPLPVLNVAGLFLLGLGVANFYPLSMSLAIGTAPQQADVASARISLGIGLATLATPLSLGWLADRIGIGDALGMVAILILLATGLAGWASRLNPRPVSKPKTP